MGAKTQPIEYAGEVFEYVPTAGRSWKVIKGITNGGKPMFDAFDVLFNGKSDEYAEILGDDLEEMAQLAAKAIEASGSKNS